MILRRRRRRLERLSSPTSSRIRGTWKGSYADTRLLTLSPDRNRGKAANPTTLLTRFAEELRRAPAAGGAGTGAQTRVGEGMILDS